MKVIAVSEKTKEWSSQYGDMVTYYVKFEGSDDAVQVNRKDTSPKPSVGDNLDGTIEESEYGLKFKAAPRAFGGGGADNKKIDEILETVKRIEDKLGKDTVAEVDEDEPVSLDSIPF